MPGRIARAVERGAAKVGVTSEKANELMSEILDGFAIEVNGAETAKLLDAMYERTKARIRGKPLPPIPTVQIARIVIDE